MEEFLEKAERWLGRIHLIQWFALGIIGAIPAAATAYLKGLPLIISILTGLGFICCFVLAIYAIRILISKFPRFFLIQMPISKAARKMYERIEKGGYGELLSHTTKSPEEKLEWMSNSILALREGKWHVKIYGAAPPSTVSHLITEDELKKLRWIEGTDELHSNSFYKLLYNNVTVNRFDIYHHIKMMKKTAQKVHRKS